MKTIDIVNLGCSKNLVDAESLYTQLRANGVTVRMNPDSPSAEVIIVNTCGFIGDAKEESVEAILSAVGIKEQNPKTEIYVMGCLSQRYKVDLRSEIPEVDNYYGVSEIPSIIKDLGYTYYQDRLLTRMSSTLSHYAYLKIAEGCDRSCAFCAIPMIRGKQISVPIEGLVTQAKSLRDNGVKELILVSQELTRYGIDLNKKAQLVPLLNELEKINGIEWIRLHYTYPNLFGNDLIEAIANSPKICNYLDIPFQHFSDKVLRDMRRGHTAEEGFKLINSIRDKVPDIALRTTMLVGHPGEDDQAFEELMSATKEIRFDRLGVFTYSHEEDTYAHTHYEDSIAPELKRERADQLMQLQQEISENINQSKIGTVQRVLIDKEEDEYFVGRTQYDSPEIDQEVLITKENKDMKIGSFFDVEITESSEFDLFGKSVS